MADTIHVDAEGNPIQLPGITQNPSQGLPIGVQHIDASGNPIRLNLPPKGSQDITESLPTAQQIGTNIIKPLPALGAAGFTALAPEAPGVSGMLGAGAGSAVQNFLKRYRPDIFTESGKTPTALEEAQNIGTNAGMEGAGQIIAKAGPEALRLGAVGISKLPAFKNAALGEERAANVEKLKSLAKRQGLGSQPVEEPETVQTVLDKTLKGNTVDFEKMDNLLKDPKINRKLSDTTIENLRTIGKATKDLGDKLGDSEESTVYMKGGKYLLKYGAGIGLSSALGVPHPYMVGTMATGALEIPPKLMVKIASNPGATKALTALMNPETPPAVAKLYQQGLLSYMRGEEMYHQSESGEREKVKINDQGVPQLPR